MTRGISTPLAALARIMLMPFQITEGESMQVRRREQARKQNAVLTLGDAIAAVSAVTPDEREVVAVVLHMLRRRAIRFHGAVDLGHEAS